MTPVRGVVSQTGHILSGIGFAMTRTAPGTYTIGFIEPFADPPAVVVTAAQPGHIACVAPTTVGAEVRITDLSGLPTDCGFAFVALAVDAEPQD